MDVPLTTFMIFLTIFAFINANGPGGCINLWFLSNK